MSLIFAVLVDASASWHGIRITPAIAEELETLRKSPAAKPLSQLAA
jgi:hypothetical protein